MSNLQARAEYLQFTIVLVQYINGNNYLFHYFMQNKYIVLVQYINGNNYLFHYFMQNKYKVV